MITQDVFTEGESLIRSILQKMLNIGVKKQSAILEILILFLSCRGRVNFSQMGRQGDRYEKTYRYHFENSFDWATFNGLLITNHCSEEIIIGFDPSYISKSGKHTPGLGYFYSGVAGGYKRGLEIGSIALIDVNQNTAYHYESITTPSLPKKKNSASLTIVDHYAEVIVNRGKELLSLSSVLVVDGYFAKKKFVERISNETDLEIICRLRDDANLQYLAPENKIKQRGRPRLYSGKVNTKNIDKRKFRKVYIDAEKRIYSLVVYSVGLKRKVNVCYVEYLNEKQEVRTTKIFFSTNLKRGAMEIYTYYKARFQMEFIFRDAKQFTGIEHCQSRSENKLNFHFNAALTSVNIAKCILRKNEHKKTSIPISVSDLKMKLQNRNMLYRIFSIYGFDHKLIKIGDSLSKVLKFGSIAA